MLMAAMLAGALLLLGPGAAATGFGVDEVVTTLLLNFIVLLFVSVMLDGPMKDPTAMGWPQSVALRRRAATRQADRAHAACTPACSARLRAAAAGRCCGQTTLGFEMRAVGANARAAAFAGVPVARTVAVGAALRARSPGWPARSRSPGRTGYVTLDMSPGYGYSGIVIAMLAGLNPLGVVVAAVFVAGVLVGADSMSRAVAVPTYIADVIVAVALIACWSRRC